MRPKPDVAPAATDAAVPVHMHDRPANRADRAPALLSGTGATNEVVLRVDVPDDPKELLGDMAPSEPDSPLASGEVLRGRALCDAIDDSQRGIPKPSLSQARWRGRRDGFGGAGRCAVCNTRRRST